MNSIPLTLICQPTVLTYVSISAIALRAYHTPYDYPSSSLDWKLPEDWDLIFHAFMSSSLPIKTMEV